MKNKIISNFAYLLVRILNLTYNYKFVGLNNIKIAKDAHPKKAYVFALWHQNLIPGILGHSKESYTMIVSESRDGELVAVTCEKLGHKPARGSSTRGGKKALLEMVRNVKNGIPGALTVDGPKGPAQMVKPGIIEIARLAKCAILPMSPYPKKFWIVKKSWDQFRIPKPFTTIVISIGEPIFITDEVSRDQFDDLALKIGDLLSKGEQISKDFILGQN